MNFKEETQRIMLFTRLVISVIVLVISCFMIFSGNDGVSKAGIGFLGAVVGFWLR